MKASFRRFVSKYYMIGSFLVVILAFIGIMNFFNTTATSVISRKKELALLEVVGMTKKQVSKMLVSEGFLYLGGAFVIAVLLDEVFGTLRALPDTGVLQRPSAYTEGHETPDGAGNGFRYIRNMGDRQQFPDPAAVPVRNSDIKYGRQHRLSGEDCECFQLGGCEWGDR